jgi:hypothetical protein
MDKFFFSLIAAFIIYHLIKNKDLYARIILSVELLLMVLVFFPSMQISNVPLAVFCFIAALCVIYGCIRPKLNLKKRAVILLITIPITFFYYHFARYGMGRVWMHIETSKIYLVTVIPAYIYILFKWKNFKTEIGFLTFIMAAPIYDIIYALIIRY